jgi:ribA/ribD-fused uncharacterized protein
MNRDPEDRIDRFSNQYEFLSNFYPCKITIRTNDGQLTFWSAEAAFQAMKTTDPDKRREFCLIRDAAEAKERGKKLKLRKDWSVIRIPVMEYIVDEKFEQNGELAQMLHDTGNKQLINGNILNDSYWGMIPVPVGVTDVWMGENHLGRILELVRDLIQVHPWAHGHGKPMDYPPCQQTIEDFIDHQLAVMTVDNSEPTVRNPNDDERINKAVDLAWRYGGIDGDHHQKWLVDQMLRKMLTEKEYAEFVHDYEESGEYKWQTGIAP